MCFGSPGDGGAAEAARREEEARQARIREGQALIEQAFRPFTDDYFGGIQQSYADYYMPQLQKQYEDARRRLTLQLAATGNLTGSAGARQLGDLQRHFAEQQALIGNQALAAANDARARVEAARQDLLGINRSSADPSGVNAALTARVEQLQAPPVYSPLADVFANLINQGANQIAANAQGYRREGVNVFGPNSGSGAVRTIGG